MKKLGIALIAVLLFGITLAFTQRAQNSTPEMDAPKSIPQLEAERIASQPLARTDTGLLTREALQQQRELITTNSSLFVMEGVTSGSVNLPITGTNAKIAVFSPTDGDLDVALADPRGRELPTEALGRTEQAEPGAFGKMIIGRGDPNEGTLLVAEGKDLSAGLYTVNVRKSKTPIDIIVNDEGGPVLSLWLADTNIDEKGSVKLFAKIIDGERNISGAQLNARVKGQKGARVELKETEPGIYSAAIKARAVTGMNTLIVEAKGNTTKGLQFMRHGSIDVVAGKSNAKLVGIGQEQMTETDLSVEVKISVTAPGRYYVRGNLLGSSDEPIAWAQDAAELGVGTHTLKLRFAREAIKQSGLSSGFKLSDVELMNTTNMPGIKANGKVKDFFLQSSL